MCGEPSFIEKARLLWNVGAGEEAATQNERLAGHEGGGVRAYPPDGVGNFAGRSETMGWKPSANVCANAASDSVVMIPPGETGSQWSGGVSALAKFTSNACAVRKVNGLLRRTS
jgi:hypothetical protein